MTAVFAAGLSLAWLAGCDGVHPVPNSIRGIQVIAIESTPAQPDTFEALTLGAWVADGLGRGADVLIWLCTPLDGRCVEAYPPGSTGLPLSLWTRVGRADPLFEASTPWPLFAGIAADNFDIPEDYRGKLLVWALACSPGLCPVIDKVSVNPRSGSESYAEVSAMLADPASWLDELPRGQVSIAVKAVPVFLEPDTDPYAYPYASYPEYTVQDPVNHPPTLTLRASSADGRVREFETSDPDGDSVITRAFVTAGGVYTESGSSGTEWVQWQAPLLDDREGYLFLVAEDQRGGTSVWTSHPDFDPCGAALAIDPVDPALAPGDTVTLRTSNLRYTITLPWSVHTAAATRFRATATLSGALTGFADSGQLNVSSCVVGGTFDLALTTRDVEEVCGALGRLVHLDLTVESLLPEQATATTSLDVVPIASQALGNVCLGL